MSHPIRSSCFRMHARSSTRLVHGSRWIPSCIHPSWVVGRLPTPHSVVGSFTCGVPPSGFRRTCVWGGSVGGVDEPSSSPLLLFPTFGSSCIPGHPSIVACVDEDRLPHPPCGGVSASWVRLHRVVGGRTRGVTGAGDTRAPSSYDTRHETIDDVDTYHEHTLHVVFQSARKRRAELRESQGDVEQGGARPRWEESRNARKKGRKRSRRSERKRRGSTLVSKEKKEQVRTCLCPGRILWNVAATCVPCTALTSRRNTNERTCMVAPGSESMQPNQHAERNTSTRMGWPWPRNRRVKAMQQ